MNKKQNPSLGSSESSGEVDAHINHHKAMSKCSMIQCLHLMGGNHRERATGST